MVSRGSASGRSVLKNMGASVKSHKAVHGITIALSMADGIPTEWR